MLVFNGKTYSGVEDMPPEVRRAYEEAMAFLADKDHDGIPDILEGKGGDVERSVLQAGVTVSTTTRIIVNGREYSSVSELPPEVREKYEQAAAKVEEMMHGKPQSFQPGEPEVLRSEHIVRLQPSPAKAQGELSSGKPLQEESTTGRFLLLAGIFLAALFLLAVVAAAFLLFQR